MSKNLKVIFATGNIHKYEEARSIALKHGITLIYQKVERVEIQSEDLETIAIFSLAQLKPFLGNSIFMVEDAGLFIDQLNGFPGPYSSYVYQTIGCKGIIRLLKGLPRPHKAVFKSIVALYVPKLGIRIFRGIVKGEIIECERGKKGFGFDPIFVPCENGRRTFAEMEIKDKNKISHRSRAFRQAFSFLNNLNISCEDNV